MHRYRTLVSVALASLTLSVIAGVAVYSNADKTKHDSTIEVVQPLSHSQFESTKATLIALLEANDPNASFRYLREAMDKDPALARECHSLLHHMGQVAYKKYHDFNETISYQDGLCNSGYTHGAIEAHLIASPDVQATLNTTCAEAVNKDKIQQWQCYHGLGHGAMYSTGKNLARSLSLCESLSTTFARSACINGTFMERFIVINHSGAISPDSSSVNTGLCKQQKQEYKSDCYFYAPSAYLGRSTNDYTGAFEDCKKSESSYINACFRGIGSQVTKENVTRPEVAQEVCKKAPSKYVKSCIEGAVSLLINHHASTVSVEPLCSNLFTQFKASCEEEVHFWNITYAN